MKNQKDLLQQLETLFGPDFTIKIEDIRKENDTKKVGYVIQKKDSNTAAIIYDSQFFNVSNIEKKAKLIYENYMEYSPQKTIDFDVKKIFDFSFCKDKIKCLVLNKGLNKDSLQEYPYKDYLDFAVMFFIDLDKYKVKVTHSILKMWNISVDELYNIARKNTEEVTYIKKMSEILSSMQPSVPLDDVPMYVFSTEGNYHGAASILFTFQLKKLANKLRSDIYILPSSVHELILMPAEYGIQDIGYLKEMVKSVNVTEVSENEILSDNVYIYKRDIDEIIIL